MAKGGDAFWGWAILIAGGVWLFGGDDPAEPGRDADARTAARTTVSEPLERSTADRPALAGAKSTDSEPNVDPVVTAALPVAVNSDADRLGDGNVNPAVIPSGSQDAGAEVATNPDPIASIPPLRLREVTASSLRMRSGPGTGNGVVGSAPRGTEVAALASDGDWVEVRLSDGRTGWMHGDYLGPVRTLDVAGDADAIGRATVTDGDTIVIGEARIRLHGIDAPEDGQTCEDAGGSLYPCGGRAANALFDRVGQQTVACEERDTDRYGRMVGVCRLVATGEDLNAFMVASGWALAYRSYSTDYLDEEDAARVRKVGLHQGRHVAPWDWRRGTRLEDRSAPAAVAAAPATPSTTARARPAAAPFQQRFAGQERACNIKGNISKSGRIYHTPGSRWYSRTKISPGKGERWFCSEQEARAAGWRAPRG